MRVWIDITNSPHVLFFEPIIRDLRAAGHTVDVTTRDYGQTVALLDQKGIDYTLIGQHQGRSTVKKAFGFASRSSRLISWARPRKFDVAFGHNSNDIALAARFLGIPQLLMFDYEYASLTHGINCRLVNSVMVPEFIPKESVTQHGIPIDKVRHVPGLKEHIYISRRADNAHDLRDELGIGPDEVFVVVRPPATMSSYHRFENELFPQLMQHLADQPNVRVLVVPRTNEQAEEMRGLLPKELTIADKVYDGVELISNADLVVSAGGTMNREAAVLGTPAYTIFAGRLGAVDQELIRRGLLTQVTKPEDVALRKKQPGEEYWVDNRHVVLAELERLSATKKR
jgi:hypothetical protein